MNEFLEQFMIESREQAEQASADLLALEKNPGDKDRLDSAFRAFHSMKGGAGIVDFTAMAEAVHLAEDALSGARSGLWVIDSGLVSNCLACIDQVVQWMDTIERTDNLPEGAQAQASAVITKFRASAHARPAEPAAPGAAGPSGEQWWAEHPEFHAKAQAAIRYTPDPDCFFQGLDPLAQIAALPGLLFVDIEPASPWPALEALDPFSCNLVITAFTQASRDEAIAALGAAARQCEVRALGGEDAAGGAAALSAKAREILEGQILLIREPKPQGAAGRMASAGVVAEHVLRHAGAAAHAGQVARAAARSAAQHDGRFLREAIELALSGTPAPAAAAPAVVPEAAARTLRVEASRLDALVRLTGELGVAKNAIGHVAKLAQDGDQAFASMLKDRVATLDRLVGELQRSVLGMRVLPLRHVFQRFPRLLREISADLGKQAVLVLEGEDTEADKAIVESLFEPLLHVLRNALDHGIEDAAAREAHGKPAAATIRLIAYRQGEHVVIEVADDGRGIDLAKVRQVAQKRGLIREEMAGALSDEALVNLIFEPGFSTADEVTGLSGRGVGMDAVRAAVGRMSGQVNLESRPGQGTTVRLTLPFSVMMTRVMVVGAGTQSYGIPLDTVVETLRVGAERISPIGAANAIVLRNRTLPVVTLAQALGLADGVRQERDATIVVTRIDGQYGALRVDRIGERMDVMLKPLEGLLAGMHGLAGSTLLGDGSVLLILDLRELFR